MEYEHPKKFLKIYNKSKDEPFISPYLKMQSIDNGDGVHVSPINSYSFKGLTRPIDLFELGVKISRYQPCLASRKSVDVPYTWLTYNEVSDQLMQFGSGLRHMVGHVEGVDNNIGIYSRNSIQWVIAMFGAQSYSYTYVPLYDTLGKESIQHILTQTAMKVLLCEGCGQANKILKDFTSSISLFILVEESPDATKLINEYKSNESIRICMFKDVLEAGKNNPMPKCPLGPDNVSLICYTSGSTGTPKGVMLTGRQIVNTIASVMSLEGYKYYSERTVYSSHLPLAHIMEHLLLIAVFSRGGRAGMPTEGIKSFPNDIKDLKPTVLSSVPRVLIKLYNVYMEKVQKKKLAAKFLPKQLKASLRPQARGDYNKRMFLDTLLFKKFRQAVGGNVCVVICGGAPLEGSLKRFIQAALKCPVLEGYGQTETSGVISVGLTGEMQVDNVGSVTPDLEVKLFDVPEMDISVKNGGSGEICVRGVRCTAGYYRDAENTAKLYHPGGWLRTGDIGMWTEGGRLKVVDRCKSMFKLSQGEYVAPEKVENVIQLHKLVQFCHVYGKSTESYCVAIVVPKMDVLRAEVKGIGGESRANGTVPESSAATPPESNSGLLQSRKVREYVLNKINEFGKMNGLQGFEFPRNIHLSEEEFTVANGLLTPTMKSSRPRVTKHFEERINEMYREGVIVKSPNEAAETK